MIYCPVCGKITATTGSIMDRVDLSDSCRCGGVRALQERIKEMEDQLEDMENNYAILLSERGA